MSYIFVFESYVKFSNIAARVVRRCVNESQQKEAAKREEAFAKVTKWSEGKAQTK